MTDDLKAKLTDVLRLYLKNAGDDPLPEEAKLVELGLDSLGSVNLVLELESVFDIEFPDRMLSETTFHTVGSLRAAVEQLVEGVAAHDRA